MGKNILKITEFTKPAMQNVFHSLWITGKAIKGFLILKFVFEFIAHLSQRLLFGIPNIVNEKYLQN